MMLKKQLGTIQCVEVTLGAPRAQTCARVLSTLDPQ